MDFKVNPYGKYVANKTINGKHCTIVGYADDKTISQVDKNIVTKLLIELKDNFEFLVISRGNKHTFLVMNMNII